MNRKFMKILKKELRKIQRDLVRRIDYLYDRKCSAMSNNYLNGDIYEVILKNGDYFSLGIGSDVFPDIKFSDIVYIRKHNHHGYYGYTDTEIGNHNYNTSCCQYKNGINHSEYNRQIHKKYKRINEIETGGFD